MLKELKELMMHDVTINDAELERAKRAVRTLDEFQGKVNIPEELRAYWAQALLSIVEDVTAVRSHREELLSREIDRLVVRLQKYERLKPTFKDTTFYHVPHCGTLALIEEHNSTAIGVALLQLDRYYDLAGKVIPYEDLVLRFSDILERREGDQVHRPRGRIIVYGRARKQRNLSGSFFSSEIPDLLAQLREEIADMEQDAWSAGVYREPDDLDVVDIWSCEYLQWTQARHNVQNMMKALFTQSRVK